MRYLLLPLIVVLVIGFGCVERNLNTPPAVIEPTTQAVTGMVGVIRSFDATTHIAVIGLVDGFEETVLLPSETAISETEIGSLLTVEGTRDLATQQIAASHVEVISSPNLYVVSPAPGATVTSPLLVAGFGRTFEQTFHWRIKDVDGVVVAEGSAMTHAEDSGIFGPFQFEVFLPAMDQRDFSLEVLEFSAKDGSETNLVAVPLKLLSVATSTFSVYFSNARGNPNALCELVFPVKRTVAQTSAVGRAALLELLKGPTDEKIRLGFSSNIPEGVQLYSLVISDGIASADFSPELNRTAGSCRVLAIRSQIVNTLNQFSSLEDVIISVDGDAETALQP